MAKALIAGGAYIVNDVWMNANGEPLTEEQVDEIENGNEVQTEPSKPLERMNKSELLEYADQLGIELDDDSTKAQILDAILEVQTEPE